MDNGHKNLITTNNRYPYLKCNYKKGFIIMKEEDEVSIYRKLQQNLDKLAISYPATESGVEIRILKHHFTPEWALLASKLGSTPIALKDIYSEGEKDGLSLEKVEKALD